MRAVLVAGLLVTLALPVWAQALTVTDGDTVRLGEERIRLEAIDAPETAQPECLAEAMLGHLATARMRELIALPGDVVIVRNGLDRYGRTLATITIGGLDLALQLIVEGLAEPWTGRQVDWCG